MQRSIDAIAAEFDALLASDFDMSEPAAQGLERLEALTEELTAGCSPSEAAAVLFRFIERVTADELRPPRYDFGTPGPLAHTLEQLPGYEAHLLASLKRRPAPLSVWMLNRLINGTEDVQKRAHLVRLLREAASHPGASAYTREEAEDFLRHQAAV